jgi:hypothetical protein
MSTVITEHSNAAVVRRGYEAINTADWSLTARRKCSPNAGPHSTSAL